jgi:hypothetical protein
MRGRYSPDIKLGIYPLTVLMGSQNSQITGFGIKITILQIFKPKNPNRRFFDFESI